MRNKMKPINRYKAKDFNTNSKNHNLFDFHKI